jgi:hypothetical protein
MICAPIIRSNDYACNYNERSADLSVPLRWKMTNLIASGCATFRGHMWYVSTVYHVSSYSTDVVRQVCASRHVEMATKLRH